MYLTSQAKAPFTKSCVDKTSRWLFTVDFYSQMVYALLLLCCLEMFVKCVRHDAVNLLGFAEMIKDGFYIRVVPSGFFNVSEKYRLHC